MSDSRPASADSRQEGWWTRDHALIVILVATTALLLIVCALLVQPFVGPLAWALALAVVAHPLHSWIARRLRRPGFAAGLAVFAVAVVIIAPAIFVGHHIVKEAAKGVQAVEKSFNDQSWRERVTGHPRLAPLLKALDEQANLGGPAQAVTKDMGARFGKVVTGSAWALVELLLTLFLLFYFFRDRQEALTMLRSLVPLSHQETGEVFKRISETIHATIYGTLVVALVQGTLGGLMFWWLGLPAPILWGAVMALLAIVPVLGAFVVWMPAAIFLAANGQWGKAALLAGWGGIVISLIDNLLYPVLVGKRLRLHTVPVFFSIVGGLAIFGTAGLVLGPVALALTDAILDIWRRRTAHGHSAEEGVAAPESRSSEASQLA